jgi:hypothetical protein
VARAKRTDRAEARRKYRAYLQAQEEAATAEAREHGDVPDEAPSRTARVRETRPSSAPAPVPGVRMGMFAAARAAYRQPHYVDDVRHIGSLVAGSNAVWPVLVMCVVGGAYMSFRVSAGTSGATNDPILAVVYQFIFYPIPLLPPMLAGFLAPRSTWLAGMIAAFIATMTLVVVVGLNVGSFSNSTGEIAVASPTPGSSAVTSAAASGSAAASSLTSAVTSATPATSGSPAASSAASPAASGSPAAVASSGTAGTTKSNPNTVGDLFNLALMLLVQSLGFGAIIGALSGWYKRFLGLTSGGPRKPPPSRQNRGRAPQRRRPATR